MINGEQNLLWGLAKSQAKQRNLAKLPPSLNSTGSDLSKELVLLIRECLGVLSPFACVINKICITK